MIEHRTLLVLGAGASVTYGFPLGHDLLAQLCSMADTNPQPYVGQMAELGHPHEGLTNFCKALLGSGLPSVDAFLARHTHSNFNEIARLAIASCIDRCERLLPAEKLPKADDWYRHLWLRMQANVDHIHTFVASIENIRIVTFNYDRSLEYFLHRGIQNSFGTDGEQAQEALAQIPIMHVYGQLAPYHYCDRLPGRSFWSSSTAASLKLAADGIKVIEQTRQGDQDFETAREWFKWAEKTCFIGFSFDEFNTRRLGFKAILDSLEKEKKGYGQVFASTYGMTTTEVHKALLRTLGARSWETHGKQSLEFLRNIDVLY